MPRIQAREPRINSYQRGYTRRWGKARLQFLRTHPMCHVCLEEDGRITPATVVDHLVPHRGDPDLFWDQTNWSAKCKTHHDQKTARETRASR